jgi:hypothetical protein
MHVICLATLILLDLITLIIFGQKHKLGSSLFNFLHSPATSCLSGLNIRLNAPYLNTLNVCPSLKFKGQMSPHTKQQAEIYFHISYCSCFLHADMHSPNLACSLFPRECNFDDLPHSSYKNKRKQTAGRQGSWGNMNSIKYVVWM